MTIQAIIKTQILLKSFSNRPSMKASNFILFFTLLLLLACQKEENKEAPVSNISNEQILQEDYGVAEYKWGYINKKGGLLIEPIFDECKNFSNGLAVVRIKGKWGYINKTGNIIIAPEYQEAYDFSESLAVVKE